MGDMKDALRKAGLVSDREARQAAHRERVRRKELGTPGLEDERRALETETRAAADRRRVADRASETDRRARREDDERAEKVRRLLVEGDILPRESGSKRYFFETEGGRVYFIDVSDALVRRLAQGDAAIVDARAILNKDYAVVPGKTAAELRRIDLARILLWNA